AVWPVVNALVRKSCPMVANKPTLRMRARARRFGSLGGGGGSKMKYAAVAKTMAVNEKCTTTARASMLLSWLSPSMAKAVATDANRATTIGQSCGVGSFRRNVGG